MTKKKVDAKVDAEFMQQCVKSIILSHLIDSPENGKALFYKGFLDSDGLVNGQKMYEATLTSWRS